MENSPVRRGRGPYKRWINEGSTNEMPRTTKWRRTLLGNEDFNRSFNEVEQQAAQNSYTEDNHMLSNANQLVNAEQDDRSNSFLEGLENEGNVNENDGSDSFLSSDDLENVIINEEAIINEEEVNVFEKEDSENDSFISSEDLENEVVVNEEVNEEQQNDRSDSSLSSEDLENEGINNEKEIPNDLDVPLYGSCKFTLGQCLLLLMSFILGNSLTASAVTDLLKLLALLLPTGNLLPDTKFLFDKYFKQFRKGTNLHLYCPECYTGLGTKSCVHCEVCDVDYISRYSTSI